MSTLMKLVETRIKELSKFVVSDRMALEPWTVRHAKYTDFGKYEYTDDFSEIKVGDIWARTGETAFMKASFVIPEKWEGKYVAFDYMTGGEGLLTLNGKPYSGADDNRGYIRIADFAKSGEKFDFEIEIKTGGYWEYLPDENNSTKPYILSKSDLFVIDKNIEKIYYDFYFRYETAKGMKDELLRDRIMEIMYNAFRLVDFTLTERPEFKEELKKADEFLEEKLREIDWHKPLGKVWYSGNSHIDVMWLWPLKETQRKVGRTYNTLVSLMEEYPEYIFNFSQVPLFKYLEKNYPETFAKVKKLIDEGRVEPIGGTWVENDTNLVSGESLVRQCLYGQRYMRGVLGADVRIGYIPDVFGYSYALPQIYKKSGLDYFITTKLSWQDTNRFPYQVFWWEGLDGSRVLTYLPLRYVDPMTDLTDHRDTIMDLYKDRLKCPDYLNLMGWGDGGGGPTRQSIEAVRRFDNMPGFPEGKFTRVHDFFDNVVSKCEGLPVYNDELYFEYHRGTYTSQANNKKNNRKSELALRDAELLSVVAGGDYPKEELVSYWETVLLNQFHDCIPGSSINEVYKDSGKDYEKILTGARNIIDKALKAIADNADTEGKGVPVFVYNTLSHERSDVAEVAWEGSKNVVVCDSEGTLIPSQIEGDKLVFVTDYIAPMSYDVYFVKEGRYKDEEESLSFENNVVKTPFYEIGINPDGTLGAIWDCECDRNVLPKMARANVLQLFEDKPTDYDAWELEHDFENRKWEFKKTEGPVIAESGPVRMVIRTKYATEKSTLVQDMTVYANKPTIDFRTKVDWHEEHTLLKAAFPVDIRSSKATYEIAYGSIERSTTNNTSKEQAQWEMSGHRWADLSEADYGVSILNDCKFGWDIKGNLMRLTLLRSPKSPDPEADMGCHEFTYSLFAHEGNLLDETIDYAHDLNSPLYAFVTESHEGDDVAPFVQIESGNVIVDCVKQAEDDDSVIVRLYEPYGTRSNVFLHFAKDIVSCTETNLLEEEIKSDVDIEEDMISFFIKPFEIRTFKIKFLD
ncbi:MAG: alpha-mannosidase [Armatimonadetes bacterium]|nr:alpha-mannosidase [Candidatus Hippobium faecium]